MKSFKGLAADIKSHIRKDIEKRITDKIKATFPEVTEFSVHVDLDTSKITIDGLTEEQAEQVM